MKKDEVVSPAVLRRAMQKAVKPKLIPVTLVGAADEAGYSIVEEANGEQRVVFNPVMPNTALARAYIAKNQYTGEWQIVSRRPVGAVGGRVDSPVVASHHETHEYPGSDTVWTHIDQFLPLLVMPTTGFTVQIFGDLLYFGSTLVKVENQTFDLSAYQPAAGAKWVLIQVDSTGTISVVEGSTLVSKGQLNYTNLPSPSADNMPLCGVKLYDGQTQLTRDPRPGKLMDFLDVRLSGYATSGGAGFDLAATIHAATAVAIADADELGYWQDASGELRKITWANMLTTVVTATDLLYDPIGSASAAIAAHVGEADPHTQYALDSALAGYQPIDTTLSAISALADAAGALTNDGAGNLSWAASAGSLPVADTTAIVKGSADATKLLRFEVDGFTAGATRVVTPPNADITLAGQNYANNFSVAQTMSAAANVIGSGALARQLLIDSGGPAITSIASFVVRSASYPSIQIVNNNSGGATTDGLAIGLEDSSYAYIIERENIPLLIYVNNAEAVRITRTSEVTGSTVFGVTESSTAKYAQVKITAGANVAGFASFGSTWTTSGVYVASSVAFQSIASGGFNIVNEHASGFVTFVVGGFATTDEMMRISGTEVVVNEGGFTDVDFRVETDAPYNAIFVDASNDSIVIMSNAAGKIGVFGAAASAQAVGIADADGTLADVTTKFNSLLGKLETYGWLAVA